MFVILHRTRILLMYTLRPTVIIENKANLMPKASAGETSLHTAAEGAYHRVLEILFEHAGARLPELLTAVGQTGNTSLHTAAMTNHRSCAHDLPNANAGADMYAVNQKSLSPRGIAMTRTWQDVEELLSDHEQQLIRQRQRQQQKDDLNGTKDRSRSTLPIWKALGRMHLIGTLGSRYGVDR